MRSLFASVLLCIIFSSCSKDETALTSVTPTVPTTMYFPPTGSDTWETVTPQTLGWDITKLNEAIDFAGTKNTYGLIILYKGRIVTEKYWNGWNMNTVYYIASAGKV